MTDKLKSRKLIAFLMVVLVNLVNGYFGNPIDQPTIEGVNELAIYYILGQGAVDAVTPWMGKLSSFGSQAGAKVASEVEEKKAKKEADAPQA